MAQDLEAEKVIITSILIAHKGNMALSEFQKEYKSIEGHPVPFGKFGCATIYQFLNKISDAVSFVCTSDGKETLCAKVRNGIQHIDRLVKQQKPSSRNIRVRNHPLLHKNSALSSKGQNCAQSYGAKQLCRAHVQPSVPVTPQPTWILTEDTCALHLNKKALPCTASLPLNSEGLLGSAATFSPISTDTKYSVDIGDCQNLDKGSYAQAVHTNPCGHEQGPTSLSRMARVHHENEPAFTRRKSANESVQVLILPVLKDKETSTSDLAVGIPKEVSACIKSLLKQYPSGLDIGQLLEKCKEKIGDTAYFMQCKHFEMVQDVLSSVSSVCVVADSEQNFRVVLQKSGREENSTALPDHLSCELTSILIDNPLGIEVSELLRLHHRQFGEHDYIKDHGQCTSDFVQNVLLAIPQTVLTNHGNGIYSVKLHKEHAMHPHMKLERFASFPSAEETNVPNSESAYRVQEVPNGRAFPVDIGEVFSPSEFYILITENDLLSKLRHLVTEMNAFYSHIPADFYPVRSKDLKPGLVCAALCVHGGKQTWHRAVLKSVTAHNVCVSCIDYGTLAQVRVDNIRRLRCDFLELPAQAIKASLAGVKPQSENSWLREAKDCFLQFASKRNCMCSVVSKQRDIFFVELMQVPSVDDCMYSLKDILVNEGLAESTRKRKQKASENFVDTWTLSRGHRASVITWNSVHYMSTLSISKLFGWQSDLVSHKLTEKGISFRGALLDRNSDPALHYKVCLCDGALHAETIQLYFLRNVPDILRVLQCPSEGLATEVESILMEPGARVDLYTILSPDTVENGNLQIKLESYMKKRGALRMAAYENPNPSTLSQLNYVEKKVDSLIRLLKQQNSNVTQCKEGKESTPLNELVKELSENNGAGNSEGGAAKSYSENTLNGFQSKLIEALMACKQT
ncbi:uncharacterized protein LOC142561682 isoform X2 [Dermacentor variabilis]